MIATDAQITLYDPDGSVLAVVTTEAGVASRFRHIDAEENA